MRNIAKKSIAPLTIAAIFGSGMIAQRIISRPAQRPTIERMVVELGDDVSLTVEDSNRDGQPDYVLRVPGHTYFMTSKGRSYAFSDKDERPYELRIPPPPQPPEPLDMPQGSQYKI